MQIHVVDLTYLSVKTNLKDPTVGMLDEDAHSPTCDLDIRHPETKTDEKKEWEFISKVWIELN